MLEQHPLNDSDSLRTVSKNPPHPKLELIEIKNWAEVQESGQARRQTGFEAEIEILAQVVMISSTKKMWETFAGFFKIIKSSWTYSIQDCIYCTK